MDLISIGELSKASGISVRALRYYDKKGFLIPEFIDENSGYRYYAPSQLGKLYFLQLCNHFDVPLSSIHKFTLEDNNLSLEKFVNVTQEKLTEDFEHYNMLQTTLNSLRDNLDSFQKKKKKSSPYFETMDERYIVASEFMNKHITYLEFSNSLIDVYKIIYSNGLSALTNRGMIKKKVGNTYKHYIFSEIIKEDFSTEQLKLITCLPKGEYYCALYPYDTFYHRIAPYWENNVEENELVISTGFLDNSYQFTAPYIEVQKIKIG
ncbi:MULTISPECIES: MerR family DNA-binding transcriptional regulator [Vagococcus]|uniref:Transcriptional regulator, MerR family n=1 Tax=Vagococcus fluvialis bH819 TaxID=1255619 RepID=A0A1X6WJY3_9ENTE|nr:MULTISPECIES: MerR family DNA-binding transcriptional regulator [Vagococcus]SLM84611.1 Transcriptional regulator, MerR family [Vagococcus fluvialis bH819]HCM89925.1 MerR family DNA-binding transcriptional regulator [Vagococcus sp.]